MEGSGISRLNRISATSLLRILNAFEPYHTLLRRQGGEYYKTGTLKGVRSRVGYIPHPTGGFYRFVIVSNTPGRSIEKIRRALGTYLSQKSHPWNS